MRLLESIKNILILGSGTLGLRIGLRCAMDGYNVKMYDRTDEILNNARTLQQKLLNSFIKKGLYAGDAETVMSRITSTTKPEEAVKNIDLVSESVTENLELKLGVYKQFAPLFPENAIITTNTSYLLPSQLVEASGAGDRFCALHFHDVFTMNVVDIMPHPETAPEVSDLLMNFGKKIQQIPVFVGVENHGYLFNQMLLSLLGAAGDLLARHVGSIQDIDRSWMGNTKMNLGPFGILDQVGLDTAWHITSSLTDKKSMRFAALLKEKIDAGKLGVKTGAGFYDYPNPEYLQPEFLN